MASNCHELTLAPKSHYITMFATHKGLKRYTHLNFGTNSACEIFQEVVNELIHNLSPSHCGISPRMTISSNGPRGTTKLSTKSNICSLIQKPWHNLIPTKKTLVLITNMSPWGLSAILIQKCAGQDDCRVVVYASRALSWSVVTPGQNEKL